MIVVDASALTAALLQTPQGLAERLFAHDVQLHVPHLIDIELTSAFRKLVAVNRLSAQRAEQALRDFQSLELVRYPHAPLLLRVWVLRSNLTPYDAAYVALAELLDMPLLTRDRRLANAPGHAAKVEVV